jgi:hypothetical protein
MMRRLLLTLCFAIAACNSEPKPAASQIGTPERAQQDSVIGASKLPGAKAVDRANDAREKANAHAAQMDSIQ